MRCSWVGRESYLKMIEIIYLIIYFDAICTDQLLVQLMVKIWSLNIFWLIERYFTFVYKSIKVIFITCITTVYFVNNAGFTVNIYFHSRKQLVACIYILTPDMILSSIPTTDVIFNKWNNFSFIEINWTWPSNSQH